MANSVETTGICLYALPAREEAVLKRVISFSSTQGRNYVLAGPEQASLLVVSDDTVVDAGQMPSAGALIIRIADGNPTQMYDVLMQRPLLVTKVMRTLDQARAMLSADSVAAADPSAAVQSGAAIQPLKPVEPVRPTPAPQPVEPVSPVDSQAAAADQTVAATTTDTQAAAPEEQAKPALSLYSQIMGAGTAKAAAASTQPVAVDETVDTTQTAQPHETTAAALAQDEADAAESDYVAEAAPDDAATPVAAASTAADIDTAASSDTAVTDSAPAEPVASDTAADAAVISDAAVTDSNSAAAGAGGHLALVVDDSAAIRKQLELELRAAGISAEFAETGEEALEKVAAQRYDLIFLDIIMPGIDGYEACRQMRMRPELKKTPIIMLSAKTSPLDEVQGVIAGASTYLTKPVKSDQFQQTLKRVSMWLENFQVAAH